MTKLSYHVCAPLYKLHKVQLTAAARCCSVACEQDPYTKIGPKIPKVSIRCSCCKALLSCKSSTMVSKLLQDARQLSSQSRSLLKESMAAQFSLAHHNKGDMKWVSYLHRQRSTTFKTNRVYCVIQPAGIASIEQTRCNT